MCDQLTLGGVIFELFWMEDLFNNTTVLVKDAVG